MYIGSKDVEEVTAKISTEAILDKLKAEVAAEKDRVAKKIYADFAALGEREKKVVESIMEEDLELTLKMPPPQSTERKAEDSNAQMSEFHVHWEEIYVQDDPPSDEEAGEHDRLLMSPEHHQRHVIRHFLSPVIGNMPPIGDLQNCIVLYILYLVLSVLGAVLGLVFFYFCLPLIKIDRLILSIAYLLPIMIAYFHMPPIGDLQNCKVLYHLLHFVLCVLGLVFIIFYLRPIDISSAYLLGAIMAHCPVLARRFVLWVRRFDMQIV